MTHRLFDGIDKFARATPQAIAFRCYDNALSYAELQLKTHQLANVLIDHGVGRGDRVGIYLHKDLQTAVAVFGILKAGAAFVPIDPRTPNKNLRHIIDHCDIKHVIADTQTERKLAAACEGSVLTTVVGCGSNFAMQGVVGVTWALVDSASESIPSVTVGADDLAYIFHTSGSTGTPKGIMHTHLSGYAYAEAAAKTFGLTANDVLSNHSALHFDMSTFDYFSGTLVGASTVIVPEEYMLMPASLAELIEAERMTVWYSVTTALTDLLLRGDLSERDFSAMRMINFGGETFAPAHLVELMRQLPHVQFNNLYGPAEVNMCTYFNIPPWPHEYTDRFTPIGRAWSIAQSLIFDEHDRPVRTGEEGELLVASDTLMKGYWKDEERTKLALYRQTDDHGRQTHFYRTGDIVRDRGDGELEFVGRRDRQVKVRGYRVELDGVEAILVSHPEVAEAAVWVDQAGDTHLPSIQAAVLLIPNGSVSMDELRRFIATQLPAYAVPTECSVEHSFPRTSTGKIDRRALAGAK